MTTYRETQGTVSRTTQLPLGMNFLDERGSEIGAEAADLFLAGAQAGDWLEAWVIAANLKLQAALAPTYSREAIERAKPAVVKTKTKKSSWEEDSYSCALLRRSSPFRWPWSLCSASPSPRGHKADAKSRKPHFTFPWLSSKKPPTKHFCSFTLKINNSCGRLLKY